jgi:hypothetical protein
MCRSSLLIVVCSKCFLLIVVRFINYILVVHDTLMFHLVVLFRLTSNLNFSCNNS